MAGMCTFLFILLPLLYNINIVKFESNPRKNLLHIQSIRKMSAENVTTG